MKIFINFFYLKAARDGAVSSVDSDYAVKRYWTSHIPIDSITPMRNVGNTDNRQRLKESIEDAAFTMRLFAVHPCSDLPLLYKDLFDRSATHRL